jgi:general secretion pathway protein G
LAETTVRRDIQLSFAYKHRLLCLAETKLKDSKNTPWYKIRLSFILTLLLLFSLVIFGAQRMYVIEVGAAREAVLKSDLQQIRNAIEQYNSDHHHAPSSLDDLVDAKYLEGVPLDPFRHKRDWVLVRPATTARTDQPVSGIVDVQSNSKRHSRDGTPYNTW